MAEEHILQRFDKHFGKLETKLEQMGEMVGAHIGAVLALLEKPSKTEAQALIKKDYALNALELEINNDAIAVFARHTPVANDLRHLVVVMKLAVMLERMGDHSKNVARRLRRSDLTKLDKVHLQLVQKMGAHVQKQFAEVLAAYKNLDEKAAVKVWHADEETDNALEEIYELVMSRTETEKEGAKRTEYVNLLLIAKNIERFGDFATNMAEQIYYLITSKTLAEGIKE